MKLKSDAHPPYKYAWKLKMSAPTSGWRNVWKKVTCFIPQAGQSSIVSSMWMLRYSS